MEQDLVVTYTIARGRQGRTAAAVDALIDALVYRLQAAGPDLGISQVVEGDEMPTYVEPGICYVVPLVEGKDKIRTVSGEGSTRIHTIPVTFVTYFKHWTIMDGLRSTRDHGYDLLDEFIGTPADETVEATVGGETILAYVQDPVFEVGYARVADYVLHWYILQITLNAEI